MVTFIMLEIAKKMFHKNVRREKEKNYFDDCGKIVDRGSWIGTDPGSQK